MNIAPVYLSFDILMTSLSGTNLSEISTFESIWSWTWLAGPHCWDQFNISSGQIYLSLILSIFLSMSCALLKLPNLSVQLYLILSMYLSSFGLFANTTAVHCINLRTNQPLCLSYTPRFNFVGFASHHRFFLCPPFLCLYPSVPRYVSELFSIFYLRSFCPLTWHEIPASASNSLKMFIFWQ